jgi:RNA polymerase sigma factor (sigma-70 family)
MRSTAELVDAVRRGESVAFGDLVRLYERAVWTTAWRVVRDYHTAQDVTQEAFLEAYRQIGQLQRPESFGVWLLRIAHRRALRAARSSIRMDVLEPGQGMARAEQVEQPLVTSLLEAVAELPEHERLVVTLRYFGGHSVADVAMLLGRPIGTVTKQLSRALERLRLLPREVENEPIRN